ncbi:MAG: helix-turn-helix domain-containing protein [Rhodobacteraceae bacterium]|nr:helix-turn-helix domain-containing protein [Paracoccaceae bacterium]MCY4195420.1 helix-turn-helix domain-containing protein [Paracoccaceae bacterium]MCY4326040.1 helix-turn-helix domain-containing protein [Paracoccaceae bacterium]
MCGAEDIMTAWHLHTFEYGTGETAANLQARVPVRRCHTCDFEYLDEEAERLKQRAICDHLGVLAPEDIRKIRENKGMTRAAFADVSGFGEASLNRWENGLSIQNQSNDRYLRLLASPEIVAHLRELTSKQGPKTRTAGAAARRFRCVEMNEVMEKEQKAFRLRLVA